MNHIRTTRRSVRTRATAGLLVLGASLGMAPAADAATTTIFKSSYRGASAEASYTEALTGCRVRDVHVHVFKQNGTTPMVAVDSAVYDGCSGTVVAQRFGMQGNGVKFTTTRLAAASLVASVDMYDAPAAPGPREPDPVTVGGLIDADLNGAGSAMAPAPYVRPGGAAQTLNLDLRWKAVPGFHTARSTSTYRNRAAGIRSVQRTSTSYRDATVSSDRAIMFSYGTINHNKDSWIDIFRDLGTPPIGTVPVPA